MKKRHLRRPPQSSPFYNNKKTLWKADRGRKTPKNFKSSTSFELGNKQRNCYQMNLEKNNITFPVTASDRARARTHIHIHTHTHLHNHTHTPTHTHTHTHTIQSPLHCTHLYTQTNTAMLPVHIKPIKPIKPFARYYMNSVNKIPSVRPTAATGTEYSNWGEGCFRTPSQKGNFESNQTGR